MSAPSPQPVLSARRWSTAHARLVVPSAMTRSCEKSGWRVPREPVRVVLES